MYSNIKLYNDDYLNVLPQLEKVDCIIADVPYNINFEQGELNGTDLHT